MLPMTTSFSKLAHHWRLMGCNYTSTMISVCFHIWSAPGIRDPTCLVLVGPYGNTNFYTSLMSISITKIYWCCRGLRFGGLELEVWASKTEPESGFVFGIRIRTRFGGGALNTLLGALSGADFACLFACLFHLASVFNVLYELQKM